MKPATQRFPQRQPMRRVLASISNTMEIGDVTTLANPEIVEITALHSPASALWWTVNPDFLEARFIAILSGIQCRPNVCGSARQ